MENVKVIPTDLNVKFQMDKSMRNVVRSTVASTINTIVSHTNENRLWLWVLTVICFFQSVLIAALIMFVIGLGNNAPF